MLVPQNTNKNITKKEADASQGKKSAEEVFVFGQTGKVQRKKKAKTLVSEKIIGEGLDVNLIPQNLREISPVEQKAIIIQLILLLVILFLGLGAFFLGLDYYSNRRARELANIEFNLKEIESEIKVYDETAKKTASLQSRLAISKSILSHHVYWTHLFKILEDNTLPTIYYQNFAGSLGSSAVISGYGLDFESVARQLLAFENLPMVKKAAVSGVKVAELSAEELLSPDFPKNVVRFEMLVEADPKIFVSVPDKALASPAK
ncbi:MAG: Uncharacterized protein G01um101418_617 [Parcubacteria group bacterium Gr01-1014_18]|nr:MAG: Uncharacterized protein Greene041636_92 [Parcubacteria group bacterium Greene0416_36]TSC80869.1 MAG: Uncharacterized protein G01um101418_617 [Parcubacteria group bacterium Gr01-1014_18]TSC99530.1 MAG: Uncharacterized protein Greene101420_197 [Parcubacteria group bacterium Greene1014_20]TSD07551.1 MAG: Uncharacterized protein Greene07142_8 [Parcubacteria group bacterium Greene0714_2]